MNWLHVAFAVGLLAGVAHLAGVVASVVTDYRYWPPGERDWRFYATWTLSHALSFAIVAVGVLDWNALGLPWPAHAAGVGLFVAGYAVALKGGRDLGFAETLGLEGELQVEGLYRYSRNPQYVGYLAATVGAGLVVATPWALPLLGVYAVLWVVMPFAEEPWLVEQHGAAYERYRERVPRFVGRRGDPVERGSETAE